jgi:hypothetical protein
MTQLTGQVRTDDAATAIHSPSTIGDHVGVTD